jgi:preprotein translocase subunit SecG
MKNTIRILGIIALVAIIGLTMMACGGGGGGGESPSSVAKKCIAAVEKGDEKGIAATMTDDSAALVISLMEKAKGQMVDKKGVASTEEKIDGDKAVVKVTYKDGSTDDLNLVKVDGKWKVTVSK